MFTVVRQLSRNRGLAARITIKEENINAWLNPDAKRLDAMQAILDDLARPYYEHQLAA
jgi:hypothetical protein